MKRLSCLLVAILLSGSLISLPEFVQTLPAQEVSKDVLAKIRQVSVSLAWEGKVVGSGTLVRRGEETWVITCKHVVHPGDWRKAGLMVLQRRPDGRVVGVLVDAVELSADDDVAMVRADTAIFPHSAGLHCGKVGLDTPIVHCGSLAGQHQTVTRGWLVGLDRPCPIDGTRKRDQVSLPAQGGSSGGGVFLAETGEWIGMIVSGTPPHVIYMVPLRYAGLEVAK